MAEYKNKTAPAKQKEQEEEEEEVTAAASTNDATEAVDDLLDEIDSVLEENAEEFVRTYVQKGGE